MQSVYDIAHICALKGVKNVIISPGSRSAPITIAFARHPHIQDWIVPDERAAAFIAIGMAQQFKSPVALVCTSGSAAFNYAPAIAEAYYQQIPLVVITADRPPEWIDQLDGQTINQKNIFGSHVKEYFDFPVDLTHNDAKWHSQRIISEAINIAKTFPQGPVHVNVPLREPFYPSTPFQFSSDIKVVEHFGSFKVLSQSKEDQVIRELRGYQKILIVVGQGRRNSEFIKFANHSGIPIIADIISNCNADMAIAYHDMLFMQLDDHRKEQLKPDLLITIGNSIISKSVKQYLRKYKPEAHWHIQESGVPADTFQSLTRHLQVSVEYFLNILYQAETKQLEPYFIAWKSLESKLHLYSKAFFENIPEFSEFEACYHFLNALPDDAVLHLANSMSVRYANVIGIKEKKNIEVFANRGTSGIDGTVSTALGAALATGKQVFLIVGDMSFLYDRNAFWHNHLPDNLKILVLNNHGGGIFRMIDGPAAQPEGEKYFVTYQHETAKNSLADYNISYTLCQTKDDFLSRLPHFMKNNGRSAVLEVETNGLINTEVWKLFKQFVKGN